MKSQRPMYKLGWPRQCIHPSAAMVYAEAAKNDSNHVAFTSRLRTKSEPTQTMFAEMDVIQWFQDLHGQPGLPGEMVSGATEGTLTALYAFREHAASISQTHPTVVISPLTHYSVKKACRILGLRHVIADVDESFGYDIEALRHVLQGLQKSGDSSAIVVSTLGYTQTGTRDPIPAVADICLASRDSGLNCYHHIDAAIGGLVAPFLGDPCIHEIKGVDAITTDFHKFGWCPYGTGILLLREEYRAAISETVPYVRDVTDASILSSRSSLPALAARAVIRSVSHTAWSEILHGQVRKRDLLARSICELPGFKIVSAPTSLPFLCFSMTNGATAENRLAQALCLDSFQLPGVEGTAFRLYLTDHVKDADMTHIINLFERVVDGHQ